MTSPALDPRAFLRCTSAGRNHAAGHWLGRLTRRPRGIAARRCGSRVRGRGIERAGVQPSPQNLIAAHHRAASATRGAVIDGPASFRTYLEAATNEKPILLLDDVLS